MRNQTLQKQSFLRENSIDGKDKRVPKEEQCIFENLMFYPGMEEIYDKYMETPTWGGMFHACEFETSLMLAVKPVSEAMRKDHSRNICFRF